MSELMEYRSPTPTELRLLLSRNGLSGSAAGRLLGVNSRTVRKWTGGTSEMPWAAWALLSIVTGEMSSSDVSRITGVALSKSDGGEQRP